MFVALIAIASVLMNQVFLSRRARKEKLINKVEEAYLHVTDARNLMAEVHLSIVEPNKFGADNPTIDEKHKEVMGKLRLTKMIASLYFQSLSEHVDTLEQSYIEAFLAYGSADNLIDYLQELEQESPKIEASFTSIYAELDRAMKKVMH